MCNILIMTCFSTLTKTVKLHIQHYDLFCVKMFRKKLYMTNSEFISLTFIELLPHFTNHFLKSPFLIQESITSTQAEPLHVLSVPHKVQSAGKAHIGSGTHWALSVPPCLSSLIHFSPPKMFPSTSQFPPIKILPTERFISNTNHLLQDDFFTKNHGSIFYL